MCNNSFLSTGSFCVFPWELLSQEARDQDFVHMSPGYLDGPSWSNFQITFEANRKHCNISSSKISIVLNFLGEKKQQLQTILF